MIEIFDRLSSRARFILIVNIFERKQKRNTQKNGSKKFQSRRVSPSRRAKKVAAGNLLQNKKSTNQDNVKTHSTENAKTHTENASFEKTHLPEEYMLLKDTYR